MPTSETVNSLLRLNRIVPLTLFHLGLSAMRDWSETAINNSPSAAAFSFTKMKLRF